ncbi:MAG: glycosyltransferase [Rhodospirillaceae bacterium]
MKIVMMTNTYAPHVGGVARSVQAFSGAFRQRGHDVLIVCPQFEGAPDHEQGVLRVPAIQNFNGSDFSVVLTMPRSLRLAVEAFAPDIIHSHHPFLLGSTAVRLARTLSCPLVFTHHTMYEQYTHYVPGDSPAMQRFVIHLSTNYANLSDEVFAPSDSVAAILRRRNVRVPIRVVPTGVNLAEYSQGSGSGFRQIMGIPDAAFLIGHVGRLAEEKNLAFLIDAVAAVLVAEPAAHFLIAGEGPAGDALRARLEAAGVMERVHFAGVLGRRFLVSAYRAMDVFAFASLSETQGMVVSEAMAAGVPVVALDAPGVREVVHDQENGRLLPPGGMEAFIAALRELASMNWEQRAPLRLAARRTAEGLSLDRSADMALEAYARLIGEPAADAREAADEAWSRTLRLLRTEWDLLSGMADAAVARDEDGRENGTAP